MELKTKNRALKMLSQSNQAALFQKDEMILLHQVCKNIVEAGGYKMAWVGYISNDMEKIVIPVAQEGFEDDYLSNIKISWGDNQLGKGPTGTSIRTGKVCVARNIPEDPNYLPWRSAAIKRGYSSSVAIPLILENNVIGALVIYAELKDAFDEDEIELLKELANDLSFGIYSIRAKVERDETEKALSESAERLRLSTELADVAVWEFDFTTNRMSRSKNHDKLYGLEWQTVWKFETFLNSTHPNDREFSNEIIQKSAAPNGPDQYSFDFRVVYPDKSIHWLNVVGQITGRNTDGQATIARGCLIDITNRKKSEEALRESEERYRQLLEQAPVGIAVHQKGKIVFTNPAGVKLLGAESENELIGKSIQDIIDPSQLEKSKLRIQRMMNGEKGLYPAEDLYRKLDGTPIDVEVMAVPLNYKGSNAVQVIVTDITERKRAEKEKHLLAMRLNESEEIMKKNAARQLHDEVGQNLTVLSINMNYINSQLNETARATFGKRIDDSILILENTIEQIRDIMTELRPSVLDDYGLNAALKWALNKFSERTNLKTHYSGNDLSPRIPIHIAYALFRVFQEALHNIMKHAKAETVTVKLDEKENNIKLTIQDNGIGFDTGEMKTKTGRRFGLLGMEERMRFIGGKLTVASEPGKGTTITLEIARTKWE